MTLPSVWPAVALSPAVYFGTEYPGFQDNAYAGLPRADVNSQMHKLTIGFTKYVISSVALTIGARDRFLGLREYHFIDSLMGSSKRKSIVYDSSNRKNF